MVTAEHRQRHGALAAMELRSHARRGFSTSSANNASLKPPTRFCFGLHAIVRLSRALTTAFVAADRRSWVCASATQKSQEDPPLAEWEVFAWTGVSPCFRLRAVAGEDNLAARWDDGVCDDRRSVVNLIGTRALELVDALTHGVQLLGGVAHPVDDLAHDSHRISCAFAVRLAASSDEALRLPIDYGMLRSIRHGHPTG